jgi:hypothetical protein
MSPRHKDRDTDVNAQAVVAIVEEIQTQHWDLAPCPCWVCRFARKAGCYPRPQYLNTYHGRVWVDPALHEPKKWAGAGWGTEGWP